MTTKDIEAVKRLYHFHNYLPASIARLYGVSDEWISLIIEQDGDVSVVSGYECLLCGIDEAQVYYIDGNEKNNRPQNKIPLCEVDKRRLQHLQIRKRKGIITPQF